MPTKSKPFKANQRASSLPLASTKSSAWPSHPPPPPCCQEAAAAAVKFGPVEGHPYTLHIRREPAGHLSIKDWGAGAGKQREAKQTD